VIQDNNNTDHSITYDTHRLPPSLDSDFTQWSIIASQNGNRVASLIFSNWGKQRDGRRHIWIEDFEVAREYRSKGVGTTVYSRIESDILKGQFKAQVISLQAGYDKNIAKSKESDTEEAEKFWRNRGFKFNASSDAWQKIVVPSNKVPTKTKPKLKCKSGPSGFSGTK
jgi:GNAT superfamily N-acetyltransferase